MENNQCEAPRRLEVQSEEVTQNTPLPQNDEMAIDFECSPPHLTANEKREEVGYKKPAHPPKEISRSRTSTSYL